MGLGSQKGAHIGPDCLKTKHKDFRKKFTFLTEIKIDVQNLSGFVKISKNRFSALDLVPHSNNGQTDRRFFKQLFNLRAQGSFKRTCLWNTLNRVFNDHFTFSIHSRACIRESKTRNRLETVREYVKLARVFGDSLHRTAPPRP